MNLLGFILIYGEKYKKIKADSYHQPKNNAGVNTFIHYVFRIGP